jgi:hypothetical protein
MDALAILNWPSLTRLIGVMQHTCFRVVHPDEQKSESSPGCPHMALSSTPIRSGTNNQPTNQQVDSPQICQCFTMKSRRPLVNKSAHTAFCSGQNLENFLRRAPKVCKLKDRAKGTLNNVGFAPTDANQPRIKPEVERRDSREVPRRKRGRKRTGEAGNPSPPVVRGRGAEKGAGKDGLAGAPLH